MEEFNKLFGGLVLQKVGTFHVSALNANQDVFAARVKNGTTDAVTIVAMVNHGEKIPETMPMDQLQWSSVHVRSYPTQKDMRVALSNIMTVDQLASLRVQALPKVEWGNSQDFDLIASEHYKDRVGYRATASIPFKVTLHSSKVGNDRGNELETALEFIPALRTMNFTLTRQ